jgi:hypothetical protein
METYIQIGLSSGHSPQLCEVFTAAHEGRISDVITASSAVGKDFERAIAAIRGDSIMSDYLGSTEEIQVAADGKLQLSFVCGSLGYEFLIALMQALGPVCDAIEGTFDHDEDHGEYDEEMRFFFREGRVVEGSGDDLRVLGLGSGEDAVTEDSDHEETGPPLDASDSRALREACTLAEGEPTIADLLQRCLARVCAKLVEFEPRYQTQRDRNPESPQEFAELYREHRELLERSKLAPYFYGYYLDTLRNIAEAEGWREAVRAYDEACYFSAALLGMFEESGVERVMQDGIGSQEDFNTWKDFILVAVMADLEEDGGA